MKIVVVSRVYNEEAIIKYFLDHYRGIANGGFYFYDDGSTDGTLDILENDKDVVHIIKGERLDGVKSHNQQNSQRKQIMKVAKRNLDDADYILLLDVDEFITFNMSKQMDLVHFSLFDFYITEEDTELHWKTDNGWVQKLGILPLWYELVHIKRYIMIEQS